jgi:hypothetical protein
VDLHVIQNVRKILRVRAVMRSEVDLYPVSRIGELMYFLYDPFELENLMQRVRNFGPTGFTPCLLAGH